MKRLLVVLLAVALITGFCAVSFVQDSGQVSADDPVITFPDSGLDSAVRAAINKSSGDIYQSDLDGLEYLDAQGMNISDLTGLEHCSNLSTLYLSNNQINDISALSSLYTLQELSLNNNQIGNISMLSDLTNLHTLFIDGTNISDISPLSGLTNMQQLYAEENQIVDISALSSLTKLQKLYLGSNQVSNLSVLSSLINLQWLFLWGNGLSNISALPALTNLQFLDLGNNQISDISVLSGLTSLQGLSLGDNQLSDISIISSLSNLQDLSLGNNQIDNISALSGLNSLQTLNVNDNQISDVNALSGLSNMQYLDVEYNQIGNISALSGLIDLRTLLLSDNNISDISALSGFASLQTLFFNNNDISNISPLSGLVGIHSLELRANLISDIQPLVNNSGLDSGDFVNMGANPLNAASINTYIPALKGRGVTVYYSPQTLNIANASANMSGFTIYDPAEKMNNPCAGEDTYVYIEINEEGVRLNGASISSADGIVPESLFYLENESIAMHDSEEFPDHGFQVVVNPHLTYNVSIDDFEGEVDLAQVELTLGSGIISSTFVFLAIGDGVAHDVTITVAVNGSDIRSTTPIIIEARAPITEVWVDDDFNASTPGWGCDHFASIQDGIDAVSGSTVHVAEGAYYENIVLKDGVELLGAGNATTIIDGMQNGSVVTATDVDNTTLIDGFTVTNGSNDNGGGMYNYNASPVITNCIFQNNMGTFYGGGMYNNNSSPVITNCIFQNNMGTPGSALRGGGMYNMNSASSSITNCIFDNNTAYFGSGIQNYNSSPTITDCIFQNNWAATDGGGMYNENSTPVMTDCIFQNNQAIFGAGVHNWKSSPIITGCIFQNNRVRDDLPGLYNGGGMYNYDSSPIITNSVFWYNSNYYGGGMYNHDSSPIITNSVFWYNSATFGAAIYNDGSSPTVTYSNIQGGYAGEGNIDSDPLFVNASAGDFHLSADSPCIDTGNNSAPSISATDYEGDYRFIDGDRNWTKVADMGADEHLPPTPECDSWYVQYRIAGGQITMNYSAAGITPVQKTIPLSENQSGYMTFRFCRTDTNGSRIVVIPQDSWQMETFTVEDIMPGVDMDLTINLDTDAAGTLYIEDEIGDVDVISESVAGRLPVQEDTVGDGTMDTTGSMLIPLTLVGDFDTSVGQSGELPFDMIFTTGNTTNVVSIPENEKMDGATMASEGTPFAEEGGVVPYVGTNGTITATGTGDCLGIRLVGIRIDFQFEFKLELEPIRSEDVNCDGVVNVLDMIRIGQHWGQAGAGGWVPEDVNSDGVINVLDMIIIGQHWTS